MDTPPPSPFLPPLFPSIPPQTSQLRSAVSSPATLTFGLHILNGTIHLIDPSDDMYLNLYARFLSILPSQHQTLATVEAMDRATRAAVPGSEESFGHEVTVLIHAVQGLTWCSSMQLPDVGLRPSDEKFMAVTYEPNAMPYQQPFDQPLPAVDLGRCSLSGAFTPSVPRYADIILALPCTLPLGTRAGHQFPWAPRPIDCRDYAPLPVSPATFQTITNLQAMSKYTTGSQKSGLPSRRQLRQLLQNDFQDGKRGCLGEKNGLYPLRGNEAICRRIVWRALCAPHRAKVDEGERFVPATYWQHVFVDLQAVQLAAEEAEAKAAAQASIKKDSVAEVLTCEHESGDQDGEKDDDGDEDEDNDDDEEGEEDEDVVMVEE